MANGESTPGVQPPGEHRLPASLVALAEAIEGVTALDAEAMADTEVQDVVLGLGRLASQLDAATADVARVWDGRRVWASDGSRSPRARLARESWDSRATCGRSLHRAKGLASMPRTEAAYRAGRIGTDRVDVLVRANAPHRAEAFAEGEAHLVEVACTVADFDDFTSAVRYWSDAADTGAKRSPEERARRQRESRGLDLGEGLDGVGFLNGRLDAVDNEIFGGELRRLEQELFVADWAEARERYGPDARADQLARTARQRRVDALVEMATRSKACPDGAERPRPLISVVVDLPTLSGSIRELFNGTVLSPGQVASLLTEADIERIVFDGASRALDVGVRQRFFSGATRRAIEVRDRRCTHPGCTVTAEYCHVDHIIEWTDGGLTVQDNGRLLCPAHNRQRPGKRTPASPDDQERRHPPPPVPKPEPEVQPDEAMDPDVEVRREPEPAPEQPARGTGGCRGCGGNGEPAAAAGRCAGVPRPRSMPDLVWGGRRPLAIRVG